MEQADMEIRKEIFLGINRISLEELLRFIGPQENGKTLATRIMKNDYRVDEELGIDSQLIERRDGTYNYTRKFSKIAGQAYDHFYDKVESMDPQEEAHLGWLWVNLGNYYRRMLNTEQRRVAPNKRLISRYQTHALVCYYEAWQCFVQARGHDLTAYQLAMKEEPELLKFHRVRARYQPTEAHI